MKCSRNRNEIQKHGYYVQSEVSYVLTSDQCFSLFPGSLESKLIFCWSTSPSQVIAEDYYAVALIEDMIEVRSIKTGSKLQEFSLGCSKLIVDSPLLLSLSDVAFVANATNLWRLLPLDFDDQV